MFNIRKVVCATDFSSCSEKAIDTAVELASRFGAELHLVHVFPPAVYPLPEIGSVAAVQLTERMKADLQKELDGSVGRVSKPGLTVRGHLIDGVPHHEISRLARDLGGDLIVIGTHGRSGLPHLLLGSVAEKVVRTAEVPVLTVRSGKK